MSKLVDRINDFRSKATSLEPGAEERVRYRDAVVDYCNGFLNRLPDRPAYIQPRHPDPNLHNLGISEQPMPVDEVIDIFRHNVEDLGLCTLSGKFLGYIPPGGVYLGAVGDYLAAVTNEFAGDPSVCPGAVQMERELLRWMMDLVGYPDESLGSLTSGGSLATLSAIVTAREAYELTAADYSEAVVYATEHTHHCLRKALYVAGMGACVQKSVPMDSCYRMDADALERMIKEDRKNGMLPWLLVGTAGTTDLGSIDPLERLANIATGEKLWFHVDGAYGGFFALCDNIRRKFSGIERADSVVMDPHKAMCTPYGLGALLVRNGELLYRAHVHTANYLQDSAEHDGGIAPFDLGIELTRHFRGPRLWLPLKVHGAAPFRAALEEKLLLARFAWEQLNEIDGFETGTVPELSVVAFRYLPISGNVDEFNKRLLVSLRIDGTLFLSSTVIDGRYMLRLAILSLRTHLETVELAIRLIRDYAVRLEREFTTDQATDK